MAMSRRLISATLLSLTLTMVHASAALAHDGPLLGGGAWLLVGVVLSLARGTKLRLPGTNLP